MSPRPRATFAKRQKEQARRDKQLAKAQRKLDRKLGNQQVAQDLAPDDSTHQVSPVSDESPVSEMDPQ